MPPTNFERPQLNVSLMAYQTTGPELIAAAKSALASVPDSPAGVIALA